MPSGHPGATTTIKTKTPSRGLYRFREHITLYIMATSALVFVLVFAYLPLAGLCIAFTNYKPGMRFGDMQFVGLKHFILGIMQPDVLRTLKNTLVFSGLGMLASPLPALLAISMSEIPRKRICRYLQVITTFPNFISFVLVFSMFFAIFAPSDGVLNKLLLRLGWITAPTNLMGNSGLAYIFQTSIGLWKGLGYGAIVYLASLAAIDPGLYEAAEIDGAGRFRKIIHIKIPGLFPTYFTMLILGIGNLLNVGFEQFLIFYNGLVGDKLEVIDYYVYRMGILGGNYPMSTALGITKSLISITLLVFANAVAKKVRGSAIF